MQLNKLALVFSLLILITACSPIHQTMDTPNADQGQGAALSPYTYLRKLSFHLRGQTPERSEYDALAKAIQGDSTQAFFNQTIKTYLASSQHADKLALRLEELFYVRLSPVPFNSPMLQAPQGQVFPNFDTYPMQNSMNQLFRDMATLNLSWDTLLTGHNYTVYPLNDPDGFGELSDPQYYSLVSSIGQNITSPTSLMFTNGDPRIGGALTTSRFFNRYITTDLNRNRKRAAAIFRIFLCDDMQAVTADATDNQEPVLDMVFPTASPTAPPPTTAAGDPHGSDPACMQCHYKLDPMGRTFEDSGMILAPLASPGALVFKHADGTEVNTSFSGLGAAGQALLAQNEYSQCQVKHFWNWFIGEDIPLSASTLQELTAQFNSLGHKTNDFISYLIKRPEFGNFQIQDPTVQLIADTKAVLQNCNSCHAAQSIPSFTDWPIGGTTASNTHWIGAIQNDLALNGGQRQMPPANSGWQPDPSQLDTVKRWIAAGAPMGLGGNQIAAH